MKQKLSDDGLLSADERQKIADWINSKTPLVGKCPTCGDRKWQVLDHLVYSPIHYRSGMLIGGPNYPHAGIICTNCGNTQFLNAVMIGLVESSQPPGAPTNPEPGEAKK